MSIEFASPMQTTTNTPTEDDQCPKPSSSFIVGKLSCGVRLVYILAVMLRHSGFIAAAAAFALLELLRGPQLSSFPAARTATHLLLGSVDALAEAIYYPVIALSVAVVLVLAPCLVLLLCIQCGFEIQWFSRLFPARDERPAKREPPEHIKAARQVWCCRFVISLWGIFLALVVAVASDACHTGEARPHLIGFEHGTLVTAMLSVPTILTFCAMLLVENVLVRDVQPVDDPEKGATSGQDATGGTRADGKLMVEKKGGLCAESCMEKYCK